MYKGEILAEQLEKLKEKEHTRATTSVTSKQQKKLQIHLYQLNTSYSTCDTAPSALLATVGLSRFGRLGHVIGDIATVRYECPELVHLQTGSIHQLTVTVKDNRVQF